MMNLPSRFLMKPKPLLLLLLQSMMIIINNKQKLHLLFNKKNQFNNLLFGEKINNPDRSSTRGSSVVGDWNFPFRLLRMAQSSPAESQVLDLRSIDTPSVHASPLLQRA